MFAILLNSLDFESKLDVRKVQCMICNGASLMPGQRQNHGRAAKLILLGLVPKLLHSLQVDSLIWPPSGLNLIPRPHTKNKVVRCS